MAQFTQLNLGSNDPRKQVRVTQNPKPLYRPMTVVFSGALMATVFLGVMLLGTNGCSESEKIATAAPPAQSSPAPSVALAPTPVPATVAQTKPTKKKKHAKPHALATYSDPIYGVSFRYPDTYILKTGDEPQKDLAGLGPAEMNFVQPGGTTLAAVELPRNSFPGADVSSAFFTASVNPNISEAECTQFSSSDSSGPADDSSPESTVKVGSLEFNQTEETLKDFDSKYYHVFENGTCYEFGLGLGNAVNGDKRQLTEAEYEKVFDKLEKIFDTVKIEPGVVSQTPEAPRQTPVQVEGENKE
jgi:hypothetical protein